MEIETATVARQYRLMEWADQIRDCQSRPNVFIVKYKCRKLQNKNVGCCNCIL